MQVDIEKIYIPARIRKDIGDITPLKESLQRFGLLHPIIINRDFELIAGYRRLMAAKELGWKKIEVKVLSLEDEAQKTQLEIEENTTRKQLNLQEETDGYLLLNSLQNPSFFTRLKLWFKRLWKKIIRWFRKR
ncbi:ParB N-terminal domain-containing protein [Spirochaetia bacterium 38H-sp]|uniref:ParB N-terminal domain-containing protein n=1 Tax=Rarispira pelagica TaxID=3141764 RepID=A0ABU9UAZ6_9SPIR